jgi:hypothetical protein
MEDDRLLNSLRRIYTDLDTQNFDVLDFVAAFGSPLQALMYSRLFWPEFVEIDGMVFLKESMEYEDDRRRLAEALEHYGGNLTRTEQSFNLLEVPSSLFTRYEALDETTEEEEDLWLAQRLAQMWRACLSHRYPGREFVVEVLEEDTGGGDPVSVIFYQHRP